jgi:two-component system response regulator VicR
VRTVTDGRQALAMARATPPDLVVTEFMLPLLDGLEFLDALAREAERMPPVLVISTAPSKLRGSGWEVLPKPFEIDDLLEKVRRLAAQNVRD